MAKRIISTTTPSPVEGRTPIFNINSYSTTVGYDNGSQQDIVFDVVERRSGTRDSVAVVMLRVNPETPTGIEVLLRYQLRPTLQLRAGKDLSSENGDEVLICEVPAGTLEPTDTEDEKGVLTRAAAEMYEETGFRREAAEGMIVGSPSYSSVGKSMERIWFAFFFLEMKDTPETDTPPGDGPMEEGCWNEWTDLGEAFHMVLDGRIQDGKTEISLTRSSLVIEQEFEETDEVPLDEVTRQIMDARQGNTDEVEE